MQVKKLKSGEQLPYNYYSHVHRFMRCFLAEFGLAIGKCDFRISSQVLALEERFKGFKALLDGHAAHEDKAYHPLLKGKADEIFIEAGKEHHDLDSQVVKLTEILSTATTTDSAALKLKAGYSFHIQYNEFLANYFKHLNYEEMVIMPALNSHYTQEQIRQVTFNTYDHMTPQQFVDMFSRMEPYLNAYEKTVFLRDLQECQPKKFQEAWQLISSKLKFDEKDLIYADLGLVSNYDPKLFNDNSESPRINL